MIPKGHSLNLIIAIIYRITVPIENVERILTQMFHVVNRSTKKAKQRLTPTPCTESPTIISLNLTHGQTSFVDRKH